MVFCVNIVNIGRQYQQCRLYQH